MNFPQRKQLILSLLEEHGAIDVSELAHRLQVSEITVRRDLGLMAEKGLLLRTHGGAMDVKLAHEKISFSNKVATHSSQKEYIANIAANFVQDGDVIFMDCGSTVFGMHMFMKTKSVKVITNSLPLASAMTGTKISVNLVGGELDYERMATHGSMAVSHIQRYKARKAFIGVDGLSLKSGLTSHSEKEAEISLAMAQQAEQVFLLCDSSKLEQEKYFQFGSLSMINTMITDQEAPDEVLKKYRKKGLDVVYKKKK